MRDCEIRRPVGGSGRWVELVGEEVGVGRRGKRSGRERLVECAGCRKWGGSCHDGVADDDGDNLVVGLVIVHHPEAADRAGRRAEAHIHAQAKHYAGIITKIN